ncbi:OadG family transporter subunit [Nigerium massiliense]|uniref:OadG family transporter subunit n=1 Tax=Nigerium massiliense TaxID=1522317 RepID=UPI000694496D|nr:OadG family transporter subunit [Nigerium massiliense]
MTFSMDDLTWGLMMMVVGMGVVFALLLALMLVLMLIGRLDRPRLEAPAAAPEPAEPAAEDAASEAGSGAPEVRILADGLDENQVAAITVAVMTHAQNRRRQAAPETRAYAPGSQLFASRWLTVGRGTQNSPSSRR